MNDTFQLWSPPKLDLSLDSFSDDLIQQFDTKRYQNVTTVTPPEHNPEREVVETMIASPKQQQDYLPHSPVSSSLPSEHDTSKDEEEKDAEEEQAIKEEEKDDAEVEQEGQEDKKGEEEENTEQRVSNEVEEQEHEEEKASLRKSASLSQKRASEEQVERKTSDEVIAAVSSKVAPPDIKAVSVPEQPPVTPKRRSFFSFRFC